MAPFRATPCNLTVDASEWACLALSVVPTVMMMYAVMFAHGPHAAHTTFKLLTHTLAKAFSFFLPLLVAFDSALGLFIVAVSWL